MPARRAVCRSGFTLLAALALAACGGETAAPDAPAPADSLAAGPTGDLTLGEAGVGRITAATPFDTLAVRAALPPGFTTEYRSATVDGRLVPIVWALRDGQLVLEVYGDAAGTAVGRVDAPSEAVAGPGGARVGRTFADVGGADMACEAGADDLGGRAVCRGPGGVLYVFASQQTLAPTLPADDALADALLERLVWQAAP